MPENQISQWRLDLHQRNQEDEPLYFRNDDPDRSTDVYEEIITEARESVRIMTNRLDGGVFNQGNLWRVISDKLDHQRKQGKPFKLLLLVRQRDRDNDLTKRDNLHVWQYFIDARERFPDMVSLEMADEQLIKDTRIIASDGQPIGYYDFIVGDVDMYRIEDFLNENEQQLYRSFNGFNEPSNGTAEKLKALFDRHFPKVVA